MIGSRKPPSPPAMPTMPETAPMLSGNSSPTYLKVEAMPQAKAIPNTSSKPREEPGRQCDAEVARPADGVDDQLRLRIGEQEQADPSDPKYPLSDVMGAEAVGEPAAEDAKCPARQ